MRVPLRGVGFRLCIDGISVVVLVEKSVEIAVVIRAAVETQVRATMPIPDTRTASPPNTLKSETYYPQASVNQGLNPKSYTLTTHAP